MSQKRYVQVPVEPTEEMIAAGVEAYKTDEKWRAMLAAAPQPAQAEQQPVAWQARFTEPGQEWGFCTKEHHALVRANPSEWPGYETRELYAAPIAQTAPAPLAVSLSDDDRSALHQLAFELGGTEGGEYLLDAEALDELIDAALAASTGQEVKHD